MENRNLKMLVIIAVLAGVGSLDAHADCVAPTAMTTVPDGATASRSAMLATMRAVQQYNAAVTSYAACVRKSGDNPMPANRALDELQKIADRFNTELRIFKARSGV